MDRTFILAGDGFALAILRHKFQSPRATVEKIEGQFYLRMTSEFWTGDDDTDLVAAEDELRQMNGIAKMLHPRFRSVRIAGISVKNPVTGKMNSVIRGGRGICEIAIGVFAKPAQLYSNTDSIVLQDTTTDAEEIRQLCDEHEHLTRAVQIYGALPHEWRELSMVVDAIKEHHGGGKNWKRKTIILRSSKTLQGPPIASGPSSWGQGTDGRNKKAAA
jgi:hypothetical protein